MKCLDNIQLLTELDAIQQNILIFIIIHILIFSSMVSHTWFQEGLVLSLLIASIGYTHDSSGIIHIESPQNNIFKLGQFFDIWGQKFNNTQIFDFKVDNSTDKTLAVYLNGTAVNQTSYRDIPIINHEDIVIAYGEPPPKIPPYEFLY